ncbi:MAG: N-acetylmuramoyl-L-alanine amidase, partial [Candidatus Bipolaricaulaceae bacterium]
MGLLLVLVLTASLLLALLSSRPVPEVVVVIDAGHGGHDPGAVLAGVQEKDVNLAIALLVQKKAQANGLRVVLTRNTDVYVDLVER